MKAKVYCKGAVLGEEKQKKYYAIIDIIKLVMAILVIAIHTKPMEGIRNFYIINFYEVLCGISVPFFFLASGFLNYKKLVYTPGGGN